MAWSVDQARKTIFSGCSVPLPEAAASMGELKVRRDEGRMVAGLGTVEGRQKGVLHCSLLENICSRAAQCILYIKLHLSVYQVL